MADSKKNAEDVLTCPVCTETFREPVILPCQHSFCRQCIGLYAEKSGPGTVEESSRGGGSEGLHQVIACPVCRAQSSLGGKGVAGLPLNFHLAEIVERFASDFKVEDNMPCCSVCEEDNKARAVKYCTTCCCLYCKDCLASCHPMRGALKRHRLISSQEYLSQGTSQDQVNSGQQSSQQPTCTRHGQPFILYCVPCRMVICLGCVVDHPEHAVRDIPSAAEMDKPAVSKRTGELENALKETNDSFCGFMTLHSKLQDNQDLHNKEVEKAYCAALEALNDWKTRSLDDIKARYSEWIDECCAIMKRLQIQTEELERMVQTSKELLTSVDVEFLLGSTDFTKTSDDQLTEIRAALDKHEIISKKLSASVQRDLAVPRQVAVKEAAQEGQDVEAAVGGQVTPLSVTNLSLNKPCTTREIKNTTIHRLEPTLRFTETDDERLRITDEGSVVEGEDLSWGCRAVTDGRFRTGRYYWQLQITCSPGCSCYCAVGVVQEGCGLRPDINPDSDGWYIMMAYSDDEVWCVSYCDGGEIKPDYQQGRPHTGPHHVGVYLDCDQRSLIILDCGHNQVMATVRGLRVTQPLVPWVRFSRGLFCFSASARLVTGDSTTLPQVLCDMLNTS